MRIVCGTDFTPNAQDAMRVAAALARRLGDGLDLVHAVAKPPVKGLDEALWQGYLNPIRQELEQKAQPLVDQGIAVRIQLKVGAAAQELVDLAGRKSVRLLVVSSIGRVAVSRLLVGSVAERVAEAAPVPTLVVRKPAPLIGWAEGRSTLKVFVAADFSPSSDAALRWVRDLREVAPCEITVAYIDWPPEEGRRLGIPAAIPLEGNPPGIQFSLERDLRERATAQLGAEGVRVLVASSWGRPAVRAVELATEAGADLIVTGAHQVHGLKRLWQSSFSRTVLHDSPTNVVVVPADLEEPSPAPVPSFRRVLVATDFSPLGNHAIPTAVGAVEPGGILRLVHVLGPARKGGPAREEAQRKAEETLRRLVPPEAAQRGVAIEVEVLSGPDASEAIHQAAERFGAHLLCLGSHGRGGLARTLVGSVAEGVVRHSHRPVLLVRPPGT